MRAARKWVAPPGSSNHNHGEAVDLKYGKGASEWVHANAEKYGLYFPMGHEPWHVEQIGGRRQQGLHGGRPDASDTGEPYEDSGHAENLQSTPGAGYLVDKIASVESGGKADAQNPNSSAGGLGQFIDGTWLDVARRANPHCATPRMLKSWL
jgi:hypothetical protein